MFASTSLLRILTRRSDQRRHADDPRERVPEREAAEDRALPHGERGDPGRRVPGGHHSGDEQLPPMRDADAGQGLLLAGRDAARDARAESVSHRSGRERVRERLGMELVG